MPDFSMGDQFKGLPMGDLIGGPLQAACDAQVRLALSTAQFIQQIGFLPPPANTDGTASAAPSATRTVQFKFDRPKAQQPVDANGAPLPDTAMETVELTVPLLAIVKVPALSITTVDITFDMEVKNTDRSETSEDKKGSFAADASVGWGPFSLKVHVEGSVATHQANTRETDQSAKYHVEVKAEDKGMPEGLSRVLDMMLTAISPTSVKDKPADPAPAHGLMGGPVAAHGLQTPVAPLSAHSDGLDHADDTAPAATEEEGDLYHVIKARPKKK